MLALFALLCLSAAPAHGASRERRHTIVQETLPLLEDPDPDVASRAFERLNHRPFLPAPWRVPARGARCIQDEFGGEFGGERDHRGTYLRWSCRRVIGRPSILWTRDQRRVVRAIRAIARGEGDPELAGEAQLALQLRGLAPRGQAKAVFEGSFDYPFDDADEVR